jgi:hypothetical protein
MKEEIDEFITFIMSYKNDERVTITKDIKYGHKNYWITFDIDSEPKSIVSNNHWGSISGRMSIHFDRRNECIFFSSDNTDVSNIVIEDKNLLDKWCEIIEDYIASNLKTDFRQMVEQTLSSCYKKNIHREWKMKKIFDDEDESL